MVRNNLMWYVTVKVWRGSDCMTAPGQQYSDWSSDNKWGAHWIYARKPYFSKWLDRSKIMVLKGVRTEFIQLSVLHKLSLKLQNFTSHPIFLIENVSPRIFAPFSVLDTVWSWRVRSSSIYIPSQSRPM